MKKVSLILGFLSFHLTLLAQTQIGFNFQMGFPLNEFRENTEAVGVGGNGLLLFPLVEDSPFSLGVDIGSMIYGKNVIRETLNADIKVGNQVIDRLQIPLEIITNNNIFHSHLVLRAKVPLERVQPYLDGMLGFRYIYTRTRILDDSNDCRFCTTDSEGNEDRVITKKTNLDDWIFSYGGGGGLQIVLTEGVNLDFRCIYLLGGRAKYLDAKDTSKWTVEFTGTDPNEPITGNELQFSTSPKESRTDMVFGSVGVTFVF
jgi:hypothetical protein